MLYDSRIIIEYLDERFPHPPLMPVDPVSRAQFRLALHRIERDWYGLAAQLDKQGPEGGERRGCGAKAARLIVQTADFVRNKPYFVSDELSLVDVTIAPMLWRLPRYPSTCPRRRPARYWRTRSAYLPVPPSGAVSRKWNRRCGPERTPGGTRCIRASRKLWQS